uniref:Uncharacterized protein n=1 Tax=Arundo donax TaxID=35708 RepID=A0A0A9GF50_ARUDO
MIQHFEGTFLEFVPLHPGRVHTVQATKHRDIARSCIIPSSTHLI